MKSFLLYPTDLETGESCVSREVQIKYQGFFFLLEVWLGIWISCLGGGVTVYENVQQESGCGTWGVV